MNSRRLFEREFSTDNLKSIFNDRIAQTTTTGKDGVTPAALSSRLDSEIERIIRTVSDQSYHFTTYKQKLVLKGAGRAPREISIATVRDRITLRALNNIISEIFSDRRLIAPHYLIREIAELIRGKDDSFSFVQIDVQNFYPTIDHAKLLRRVRSRIRISEVIHLIDAAIRTSTGDYESPTSSSLGVPQGLSISNVLSSVYMKNFDDLMKRRFSFFRYVDDIVIVCRTESAERNFRFIKNQLRAIGLACHELSQAGKTRIAPMSIGIDYLGYNLKPNRTSVRASSFRRMMDNIMAVITAAKHTTMNKKILLKINIKITGCVFNEKRMGWVFFFSLTDNLSQLKRLDGFVSRAWRKAGMERHGAPKRFMKAYYEIRYNLDDTSYIPKFDDYTVSEMISFLSDMTGHSEEHISSWSEDRIRSKFLFLVRRETAELERDVTPLS